MLGESDSGKHGVKIPFGLVAERKKGEKSSINNVLKFVKGTIELRATKSLSSGRGPYL